MSGLSRAYSRAQTVRSELDALLASSSLNEVATRQRAEGLLAQLESAISDLQRCLQSETLGSLGVWRVRLETLSEGLNRAQITVRRGHTERSRKDEEKRVREELFGGFTGVVENGASIRERSALLSSNNMMNEIIAQGSGSLGNILSQNSLIKGTRTRMNDLLNRSGLAHVLAKTISGRERVDGLILTVCVMAVVLLVLVIWWFR